MTRKLFHITNSSVIFGCLVGFVCITNATVILGCLVYLVCYHQCHHHTWSLGLSCLSSTKFTVILGLSCLLPPMPPSYLDAWFILFVINQVHLHIGCVVYLVCHQPSSPSYLVGWFVLFAINQFHHHIWLFSVFPTGMDTSVQVYLKQCWPLMLSSSVGSSGSL